MQFNEMKFYCMSTKSETASGLVIILLSSALSLHRCSFFDSIQIYILSPEPWQILQAILA